MRISNLVSRNQPVTRPVSYILWRICHLDNFQEYRSVPDVLAWDMILRRFEWTNHPGLVRIGEQLDPALGLSSAGLVGLNGIVAMTSELLRILAVPGVVLIGSIGMILMTMLIYYTVFFMMAKILILYVCLPALVLGTVCAVLKQMRLQALEEAVLAAAAKAVDCYDEQGSLG
jgi:hypothetical protein